MRGILAVVFLTLSVFLFVTARRQIASNMSGSTTPVGEARRLAMQGKYEEALAKHLWIHNEILKERPEYSGVRRSFALSAWVDLGKQYPKALSALTEIRDRNTEHLLKGELNRDLFADVAAINDHIEQAHATVELFKKLENASPEFAGEIYRHAEEELVEAREYALARKYLGDPLARLETARKHLQEGLQGDDTNSVMDATRRAYERIFTDRVVRLITILKNTKEVALAQRLQTEALQNAR